MENDRHICILFCDDEPPILRVLHRACSSVLPQNLTHRPQDKDQVAIAAQQSAANPAVPLLALSEHPLLIIELAKALAELSPTASFGLITDGNLLAEGDIRTGHDLILVLRRILDQRLKMTVMFTGNPGEFASLSQTHGYILLAKPGSFDAIKALIKEFVDQDD